MKSRFPQQLLDNHPFPRPLPKKHIAIFARWWKTDLHEGSIIIEIHFLYGNKLILVIEPRRRGTNNLHTAIHNSASLDF